jgi:ribosomal protein S7
MNLKPSTKETNLYEKLLGFLTKQGDKFKAKRILSRVFLLVAKETIYSKDAALVTLFRKLNSFVEVKKVRVRRKFVLVPFPIRLKRRSYLVVKWIVQSAKKGGKRKSFATKLAKEMVNVLNESSSKSKSLRKFNFSKALANRSNIHFRW